MKKIMILMLSLAVLFSFAACDNSSTTPDDQQQGGSSSTTFTDGQIADMATEIAKLFNDASEGLVAKFGSAITTDGELNAGYACADPYTTMTYTYDVDEGEGLEGDTTVSITLTAVDNTEEADKNTARELRLTRYTVDFSKSYQLYENGDYYDLKGSVSGAIVGTVDVTVGSSSVDEEITPAIETVIMPDTANVTYNGTTVPSEKLVAAFTASSYTSGKYSTAAAYEEAAVKTAKKDMNSYVEFLLDATKAKSGTSLVEVLNSIIDPAAELKGTLTNSYVEGTAEKKASAEISYTPAEGEDFSITGSSSMSADLVNVTIKLEAENKGVTTGTFVPKKFEIAGTFKVYSDVAGNVAEPDFAEITLTGVTGTAAGAVAGSAQKVTDLLDSDNSNTAKVVLTFDADGATTKGTVLADGLTKVGPEVVDGELTALGDVTINYEKDATLFVAP